MGKETKAHRHHVIIQKRRRHEKIRKLKVRLATAESKGRDAINEKLKKLGVLPVMVRK